MGTEEGAEGEGGGIEGEEAEVSFELFTFARISEVSWLLSCCCGLSGVKMSKKMRKQTHVH